MIERNEFDNALKNLALRYAPKQIAKYGDIVTTYSTWTKPHKCVITMVSIEISSIDISIKQRRELGLTGWLIVQHQYIGRRLKANGDPTGNPATGFLLNEFTTSGGQKFERMPSGFNNVGLVFQIEPIELKEKE